jgi:hypothetical protein
MKHSFIFLVFITLLTLSLASCLKRNEKNVNAPCTDSCMTFRVQVSTGLNSATPLGGAAVELGWSRPASPLGDPGRLIAKGTTAANGTINFSFKARAKELLAGKFYVTAGKGDDYFLSYNDFYGVQKYDSVVNALVHTPSKATLKIVYKNFTPADSADYFGCVPYYDPYGSRVKGIVMTKPDGQLTNTFFSLATGSFAQLELTGTTAGDQYTYFSILRKKNGTRVDLKDSIYIPKGQSKTYEVQY